MRKASSATPGNTVLSLRSPYAAGWTNQGRISLPVAQNPSHQCGQRFSKLFKRPQLAGWRVCCRDADVHMDFDHSEDYWGLPSGKHTKNTLLRVIPTMTLIHFVTGKSSGISSGILSGILSGISHGILSGISSGILSGILSSIFYGILSGISSGILSDILSGISSGILSGRWGPPRLRSSSAHWAGKVPGWGPAVWAGPRLRSSGAHWAGKVPGWGPGVPTELGRSQVEVQRCTLSSDVGEELGEELARQQWTWKWRQRWWRRCWRRRSRRGRRRIASRGGGGGGQLW